MSTCPSGCMSNNPPPFYDPLNPYLQYGSCVKESPVGSGSYNLCCPSGCAPNLDYSTQVYRKLSISLEFLDCWIQSQTHHSCCQISMNHHHSDYPLLRIIYLQPARFRMILIFNYSNFKYQFE